MVPSLSVTWMEKPTPGGLPLIGRSLTVITSPGGGYPAETDGRVGDAEGWALALTVGCGDEVTPGEAEGDTPPLAVDVGAGVAEELSAGDAVGLGEPVALGWELLPDLVARYTPTPAPTTTTARPILTHSAPRPAEVAGPYPSISLMRDIVPDRGRPCGRERTTVRARVTV